jgi:hypothetical protein
MPARTVAATSGGTRLRDFHPGWFGAVMGTAVIGVIASGNPGHFRALAATMKDLSIGATALAAALGVLIAVPYLARWIIYPGAAWADMRDPTVGPLHGTFPGGSWSSPWPSRRSGHRCFLSIRCRPPSRCLQRLASPSLWPSVCCLPTSCSPWSCPMPGW